MKKKILTISIILFIACGIMLTITFIKIHDKGTPLSLDPIDDIRNYDTQYPNLNDDELSLEMLNSKNEIISNLEKLLNENIKVTNIQNYYDDKLNDYKSIILIIDKEENKKISRVILFYKKDGTLYRIKLEFDKISQDTISKINASFIKLEQLNISVEDQEEIINGLKDNYEKGKWTYKNIFVHENSPNNNYQLIDYYIN